MKELEHSLHAVEDVNTKSTGKAFMSCKRCLWLWWGF